MLDNGDSTGILVAADCLKEPGTVGKPAGMELSNTRTVDDAGYQ